MAHPHYPGSPYKIEEVGHSPSHSKSKVDFVTEARLASGFRGPQAETTRPERLTRVCEVFETPLGLPLCCSLTLGQAMTRERSQFDPRLGSRLETARTEQAIFEALRLIASDIEYFLR